MLGESIELYAIFGTGECVIATEPRVAEMAKLAENSFRDVNIALANELSLICDKLGMNVWELISLANRHHASTFSNQAPVLAATASPLIRGHCIFRTRAG